MEKVRYIINLVIVALLLLTVAIHRNGTVAGTPIGDWVQPHPNSSTPSAPTEWQTEEGIRVVSSVNLAKNVIGFGGTTPVRLYLQAEKVVRIEADSNGENPEFMASAVQSGLLERWNGLELVQAVHQRVDAVSGATLTSQALISTITQTLAYAADTKVETAIPLWSVKNILGILIIALGIVVSLYARQTRWRMVQLGLNVGVLGVWCGSFLSLTQTVNWLSSGVNLAASLIPLSLLVVALVMPLFRKRGHYCAWHCPLGSLQELTGRCVKRKPSIPPTLLKYLNYLREGILLSLLFMMWIGVGFNLMDYELFSAFLFTSAGSGILVAAGLFLVLSLFVHRPYCRFICPTGALLTFTTTQNNR